MSDAFMTILERNSRDFQQINETLRARFRHHHDRHGHRPQYLESKIVRGKRHEDVNAAQEGQMKSANNEQATTSSAAAAAASPALHGVNETDHCFQHSSSAAVRFPASPFSSFPNLGDRISGGSSSSSTGTPRTRNDPHKILGNMKKNNARGSSFREWPDVARGQDSARRNLLRRKLPESEDEGEEEAAFQQSKQGAGGYPSSSGHHLTKEDGEEGGEEIQEKRFDSRWITHEKRGDRPARSGLDHVKKRLWGSVFEAAEARIHIRRTASAVVEEDNIAQPAEEAQCGRPDQTFTVTKNTCACEDLFSAATIDQGATTAAFASRLVPASSSTTENDHSVASSPAVTASDKRGGSTAAGSTTGENNAKHEEEEGEKEEKDLAEQVGRRRSVVYGSRSRASLVAAGARKRARNAPRDRFPPLPGATNRPF